MRKGPGSLLVGALAAALASPAEGGSILYDPAGIAELVETGDAAVPKGTYQLWAWIGRGLEVEVRIGGRTLAAREDASSYGWYRLGAIDVGKGGIPAIEIPRGRERIGYLALLASPKDRPERLLELVRIAWDRAGPPPDGRIARRRDTRTPWSFPPVASREAWEARRRDVRDRVLFAAGLYPFPPKPPLKPRIYARFDGDGFTVERVLFASRPGVYVTGNLWKPREIEGRLPGILCPHGHWGKGRFQPEVQLRCMELARLGAIVFSYDMVGFGDSRPLPHRFGSDVDALHGLSVFGLQLWNSIRALDFILSLPGVDPGRIGCTGASGGGTQTFILMAADDRLRVAAPVCMVSHSFQGGCICENGPGLRIDTYNVEIAATFAPRPLILVAATGDWTRELPEKGYPEIRSIYEFYGARDRVTAVQFEAPHNYNEDSREAVYRWFGRWLYGKADADAIEEPPLEALPREAITCWIEGADLPGDALDVAGLQRSWRDASAALRETFRPRDAASWKRFRGTFRRALELATAARVPPAPRLACEKVRTIRRKGYTVEHWLLGREGRGDRIPAVLCLPTRAIRGVVAASARGKAAFAGRDGWAGPILANLLASGRAVLAIDPYLTGEYVCPVAPQVPPEKGNYFTTYNRTRLMHRIQDILTAAAFLRERLGAASVDLLGRDAAGPWALLAAGLDGGIERIAADLDRFAYRGDETSDHPMFMPHAARLGGIRVLGALAAPRPLLLYDAGDRDPSWIRGAYEAAEARARLRVAKEEPAPEDVARWLAGRRE